MCDAEKFLKNKPMFYRKRKACDEQETAVVVKENGKTFGICRRCWEKIGKSDLQWA